MTPAEEQIERAALAAINHDRDDYGLPPLKGLLELGREEAHRRIESMRAALTAAGVAPQEPVLDPEKVAAALKRHNVPYQAWIVSVLQEAAKRGELS